MKNEIHVRKATDQDAVKLAKLLEEVDRTSEYMLWEAGERKITAEKQSRFIAEVNQSDNSTILVAEQDEALVGYLFAIGGRAKRNKHSAYLVIGISQNHRGKGIGTKLFEALERWAENHHIRRLELTVVIENDAAIRLYKKFGFEIEGTKRNSLYIKGKFMDEYYMSKWIGEEQK